MTTLNFWIVKQEKKSGWLKMEYFLEVICVTQQK